MHLYTEKTDEVLVELLRSDDDRAFTELYDRYWKKLFIIAANRIKDLADAEEVVQDIFTELWRRRNTLNLTSSLANFLAVSVKYRVNRTLRKQYKQQLYIDSILHEEKVDNSTQETLAFDELREELAKYVSQLPEKCQLVFRLSKEEGYSQKQIAEELQISEKTVEAHLGKAYKTLRSKLAGLLMNLL